MGLFESERLSERRHGQKKIKELKDAKNKTLIIHYSCESFFNLHGRTPRITCIGIKNRESQTSIAFSIHLQAQFRKQELCCLSEESLDSLEREMLREFYDYIKKHSTYRWVHWNMRNASYGFAAIENRYRILGGRPRKIEEQFKYDLPEILGTLHTYKFEKHQKPSSGQLMNISIRNSISTRDALTGAEEAAAFERRDYIALHMSTMRKIEMIDRVLTLQEKKELKVNVSIFRSCGITIPGLIEIVKNNWLLFLIYSILMAILGMALEPAVQRFFGTGSGS